MVILFCAEGQAMPEASPGAGTGVFLPLVLAYGKWSWRLLYNNVGYFYRPMHPLNPYKFNVSG